MAKPQKYQERIARRILTQVGGSTMLYCLAILVTAGLEVYYVAGKGTVTASEALNLLLLLVAVICLGALACLVLLYFIARNAARDSIRPLTEALEREKMFTSYASHELRTPLAVIKGSLEVLIRRPRTEEEYRRKIVENISIVDEMNAMVDNLLTLTRVESGKMRLAFMSCNAKDLLTEACTAHADTIVRRGLKVSMNVEPEDLKVTADRMAAVTLLSNVIGNAAKYCNDGGAVALRAVKNGGEVAIEVENSGPGMSEEETRRVFDAFYRSISSSSQKAKGFGLGLAIVRRMADLLNGKVYIDSKPEGPTVVHVELPG